MSLRNLGNQPFGTWLSGSLNKMMLMQLERQYVTFIIQCLKINFFSQHFEERPVWTKAALAYCASQVEPTSLKYILTASAYYFTTGPWRNAWIRIGYDPRKDPSARFYQILDYRILQTLKSKVTPKRSYTSYTQPHKYGSAQRNKTSLIRHQQEAAATESIRTKESFAFYPGSIPKCRQMFYQVTLLQEFSLPLVSKIK